MLDLRTGLFSSTPLAPEQMRMFLLNSLPLPVEFRQDDSRQPDAQARDG
jgi:hypothetical protein